MARRNMRMEEYLELVYQWHRGRSIRQIRDSLQISRKTIRKYLLLFMASGLSREKPLPPQAELARIVASVVQVAVFEQPARERIRLYHRQIQDWLGQPHMTIQQVQRLLEEEHELKVSYMSVYRYVREHIEPLRKPVTGRLHAVAGEQAQVDFGYAGLMRDPENGQTTQGLGLYHDPKLQPPPLRTLRVSPGQPHLVGLPHPRLYVFPGLSPADRVGQFERRCA